MTLEPGWHWAEHLKPKVQTETCQVTHLIYGISGRMRVRLESGEDLLIEPGEFAYLHAERASANRSFVDS